MKKLVICPKSTAFPCENSIVNLESKQKRVKKFLILQFKDSQDEVNASENLKKSLAIDVAQRNIALR